MIDGAHVIVYSRDAEADRAFLRDILRSNSVDAGDGWLIFRSPSSQVVAPRCRPRPMRAGACSRRSRCRAEPRCPSTSRDILSRTPGEHRLDRSRTYGIDPSLRSRKHVL